MLLFYLPCLFPLVRSHLRKRILEFHARAYGAIHFQYDNKLGNCLRCLVSSSNADTGNRPHVSFKERSLVNTMKKALLEITCKEKKSLILKKTPHFLT